MDLAEWYAAGRWVGLLDYIDGLPTACRLNEAIVNDPEAALVIANMPRPDTEWSPRVAEFDLNAHLLREILHAVKSNGQIRDLTSYQQDFYRYVSIKSFHHATHEA